MNVSQLFPVIFRPGTLESPLNLLANPSSYISDKDLTWSVNGQAIFQGWPVEGVGNSVLQCPFSTQN